MSEPSDVVKALYAAFGARDDKALLDVLAPDVEWIQMEGFPGGATHRSAEAVIRDAFGPFRKEWSIWRAPVARYLADGEDVIALGEYVATHGATGRSIRAPFAHHYTVRNERIVRFQQYTDTRLVAEASGRAQTLKA